MDTLTARAKVVIVAGKGGVGKTTVTALLARSAAHNGLRVLAIELDGKPQLADLLGSSPVEVLHLAPAAALREYLVEHGFARIAKRLAGSGVIDVVSAAAPGIDDLVVLGKIKQLERSGEYDLIVVDGPAAGHAVTLLTSAAGLQSSIRSGPVHTQAAEVIELLHDPQRCRVVLVTVPERTPIDELLEASDLIEDRAGVQLAAVVVNRVDPRPPLATSTAANASTGTATAIAEAGRAAAEYRNHRHAAQEAELDRLAGAIALPILVHPEQRWT